jgi:ribonuclease P protein component
VTSADDNLPFSSDLVAADDESKKISSPDAQPRLKFPKSARMPAGGPYQRVFQARQVVSDSTISLHVLASGLGTHRLGLGVSKKMFRRAVDRNRIKRLIREAFRLERPGFGNGLDLVVRPKIQELSLGGLRESLKKLVPRAEQRFLKPDGRQSGP